MNKTIKTLLSVLCFLMGTNLSAQIADNFESGEITSWTESTAQAWAASADSPINGGFSLHHIRDNADAGTDQISIPLGTLNQNTDTIEWKFQVRHGYNPSASNNWAAFLTSSGDATEMTPEGNTGGYILGINFDGSDDILILWKLVSGTLTEVCNTEFDWQESVGTDVAAGVVVRRKPDGTWIISIDANGGFESLVQIGTANDTELSIEGNFGFYYSYSSSQDRKLWVDDISVAAEIADIVPPNVVSSEATGSNSAKILFSEAIDSLSACTLGNYSLNQSITPIEANHSWLSPSEVVLTFASDFVNLQENTIVVANVADNSGNEMITAESTSFTYEYFTIISVHAITQNSLEIKYNRPYESASALETSNYLVDNGITNPATVIGVDETTIELFFAASFANDVSYHLSASNIFDLNGAPLLVESYPFNFYTASPYDVIISEIMADPTPPVELPEAEYVELYNRTSMPILLKDWVLYTGTTARVLPDVEIAANGYIIVCKEEFADYFSDFGTVAAVSSLAVSNSGQELWLTDQFGIVVSALEFSEDWYKDSYKAEGGWSLERIDLENPCGGIDNWTASTSVAGGTPNQQNSVIASNLDEISPLLKKVEVVEANHLILHFDECLDTTVNIDLSTFEIDVFELPTSFKFESPLFDKIHLFYATEFEESTIYTIQINGIITDCIGNEIQTTSMRFAIPQTPDSLDLVFNEILFDPLVGGAEFIEVYNNSQKTIDIAALKIGVRNDATMEIESIKDITTESYLLFAGEYAVLTDEPEIVKNQYFCENEEAFVAKADILSLSNTSARIVLIDNSLRVIDEMAYNESMQFALLTDNGKGVSLEKLNPEMPSLTFSSWHSAAQTAGFGTPTSQNSQYRDEEAVLNEIEIEPEVFSPDNDGYEDIMTIKYNFETTGYVANVEIYDANGRRIRRLANNQLLGRDDDVVWDGICDDGSKARIGIYVLYIEMFNTNGDVKKHKKVCVVAGKMD